MAGSVAEWDHVLLSEGLSGGLLTTQGRSKSLFIHYMAHLLMTGTDYVDVYTLCDCSHVCQIRNEFHMHVHFQSWTLCAGYCEGPLI